MPDFYEALGSFLLRYSETEALVQTALWQFACIASPSTAQAVFGNTAVERAIATINRIAAAEKWSKEKTGLREKIFTQLGRIKDLRNNILHYGAQLEAPYTWRVTSRAHVPENVSSTVISPATLKAAEQDLEQIDLLLLDLMMFGRDDPKEFHPDKAVIEEARKCVWNYRPPEKA